MKKFKLLKLTGKAVPTTDSIALKYAPHLRDVAIYRKGKEISRYTTPGLRHFARRKTIMHNCFLYDFTWKE